MLSRRRLHTRRLTVREATRGVAPTPGARSSTATAIAASIVSFGAGDAGRGGVGPGYRGSPPLVRSSLLPVACWSSSAERGLPLHVDHLAGLARRPAARSPCPAGCSPRPFPLGRTVWGPTWPLLAWNVSSTAHLVPVTQIRRCSGAGWAPSTCSRPVHRCAGGGGSAATGRPRRTPGPVDPDPGPVVVAGPFEPSPAERRCQAWRGSSPVWTSIRTRSGLVTTCWLHATAST